MKQLDNTTPLPEESATGASNGALSRYLYKYGAITEKECSKLIFEQGYSMVKPSEICIIFQKCYRFCLIVVK